MISPDATIHRDAKIGESTSIDRGSVIDRGVVIGDRVTIGADVIVGSDAVISPNTVIKTGSRVLPGTSVTDTVAARAIVEGDPFRTIGFVGTSEWPPAGIEMPHSPGERISVGLGGCGVVALQDVHDSRGSLLPIELTRETPFIARRLFFVHGVVEDGVRGQHAHRQCDQLLFAIAGGVSIVLDDGSKSVQIRLDRPNLGIHLPSGVWVTHYQFTEHAVLAVLAELPYDPEETIGSYDDYLRWRAAVNAERVASG